LSLLAFFFWTGLLSAIAEFGEIVEMPVRSKVKIPPATSAMENPPPFSAMKQWILPPNANEIDITLTCDADKNACVI
jgi:uncharacterized membrane protein YagU involved in acid resistance